MRTYSRYDFEETGLERILRLKEGWDVYPLSDGRYEIRQEDSLPYFLTGEIELLYGSMGKLRCVEFNGMLNLPGASIPITGIEHAEVEIAARGLPQAWVTTVCLSAGDFIRKTR